MVTQLTPAEVRVLGAVIEKQISTPEYYPLSLNALIAACNQKSNRDPVVVFDEDTVREALRGLREKQLAREIFEGSGRVAKYGHTFTTALRLERREVAVLCELMLRGPQTVGELRNRTGRLYEFKELTEVEETLRELEEREEGALVVKLTRQAGLKEPRYAHLLAGTPAPEAEEPEPAPRAWAQASGATGATHSAGGGMGRGGLNGGERVTRLEEEVAALRRELNEMQSQFAEFRKQFE